MSKKNTLFPIRETAYFFIVRIAINYANNDQVPQGIRAKIKINPRM